MASGSSPDESKRSKAASRRYRISELRNAHIYINVITEEDVPERLWALIDRIERSVKPPDVRLVQMYFKGHQRVGLAPVELNTAEQKVQERLFKEAKRVREKALELQGTLERQWQRLVDDIFSSLRYQSLFTASEDELWDRGVAPVSGEYLPLSTPKPDLGLGPLVVSAAPYKGEAEFSEAFLLEMEAKLGLHARISSSSTLLCYPFFLLECKSDSQPVFYSENQAAGGAARALWTLEEITLRASQKQLSPIFAVATMGALWKIFIAFKTLDQPRVDLVQIFECNITRLWDAYALLCRLEAVLHWGQTEYRVHLAALFTEVNREIRQNTQVTEATGGAGE